MALFNLERAITSDCEPLDHLRLYCCNVPANMLAQGLLQHAKTLKEFILEEITITNGTLKEVFNALGSACNLKELVLLLNRNYSRLSEEEEQALIEALKNMPHLVKIQISRAFTTSHGMNAAIATLQNNNLEQFILHENATDPDTLKGINNILKISNNTIYSFEIFNCSEMFTNQETNNNFLDGLRGCNILKYVGIHENNVDEKAFNDALKSAKIKKFEVRNKR